MRAACLRRKIVEQPVAAGAQVVGDLVGEDLVVDGAQAVATDLAQERIPGLAVATTLDLLTQQLDLLAGLPLAFFQARSPAKGAAAGMGPHPHAVLRDSVESR